MGSRICRATSGSGVLIGTILFITGKHLGITQKVPSSEIIVFCVAARGQTIENSRVALLANSTLQQNALMM